MKKIILGCLAWILWNAAQAQFKNDNLVYKTVYLEDLCQSVKQLNGGLLLDVRSPGEFSDTSAYHSLNIGRLKGAVNISSREIQKRLDEIRDYRDKPILLICSHSQRSRVVSKMLVDSGFTNVTNVNGGMTELNRLRNGSIPCLNELYTSGNEFNLLSPAGAFNLVRNTRDLYILDVRPDTAFQGKTASAMLRAHGRFKKAVNQPLISLKENTDKIPRDKPILILDQFGDDAVQAARILADRGFKGIHVLFDGLAAWITETEKDLKERKKIWEKGSSYGLINSQDLHRRFKGAYSGLILDIRPYADFNNQNKNQSFRNKGHIRGAINIPENELKSRLQELTPYKNKEIIVYAFSGNPEAFAAAEILIKNGFKKVKVLTGGLFALRWEAANLIGMKEMMNWVVNVPPENY
ncbi:MAG TPA: rhodanese-like domain-containing protein [Saprospiraceae bacterium]|nr:rhodanese-like domain-containing protein [Saprospiraceae bacterium]HNT20781.1 rhodanese-like domain-containing protein [Saprospiraceae bacterium]